MSQAKTISQKWFHSLSVTLSFVFLFSCQQNQADTSVETSSNLEQDSSLSQPKADSVAIEAIDSTAYYQELWGNKELRIFTLHSLGWGKDKQVTFVPLTERVAPDSQSIASEYLGEMEVVDFNHHILEPKRRAHFLERVGIDESDKLYALSLSLDKLFVYRISELPLMALLSPYVHNEPLRTEDYMIGFEGAEESFSEWGTALIYIGKQNPFHQGNVRPLVFEPVNPDRFPKSTRRDEYLQTLHNDSTHGCHIFSADGYDYFVQNIAPLSYWSDLHLAVVDQKTGSVVFDKFYSGSEGASPTPLNIKGDQHDFGHYQYSGKIFKGKPPVVLGFLSFSFGCEWIDFFGDSEPSISVQCDNRH